MPNAEDACEARQAEFIRLLQGDEEEQWRLTYPAMNEGRRILPNYQGHFGVYAVNLFILDLLQRNFPMHQVELGSGELGCVMNAQLDDGRPLYIKLKIEDEMIVVMSFHISIH